MRVPQQKPAVDRFKARLVITPGCWLWTGYRNKKGYGSFFANGKMVGVHRFSYEFYVGPIGQGLIVCHTCDVPSCANPDHLWLGTDKTNAQDKMAKGRWSHGETRVGEKHPLARLTEDQVYAIRADARQLGVLAEIYKTTKSNIKGIKSRVLWKHLPARDCDVKSIKGHRWPLREG